MNKKIKITRDNHVLVRATNRDLGRLERPEFGDRFWTIAGESIGYPTRKSAAEELAFRNNLS